MKKLLFGLFIAIAFMSCKGDDGRDGRDGKDGQDAFANMRTISVVVDKWTLVGEKGALGSYYSAEVDIPELTNVVFEDGIVVSYLIDPTSEGKVKRNMPFTLYKGTATADGEQLWSETYSMDYWTGTVEFRLTYSDFVTDVAPEKVEFNLVLLWN